MKDVKGSKKGEAVNTNYWDNLWLEYQSINIAKIANYFKVFSFDKNPHDAHILDIGCGSGQTLKMLEGKGFTKLSGIEPAKKLFQDSPYDITEDNLLDMKSINRKYDVVLVFGVLHHLRTFEEMKTALQNIKRVMKKGGTFYSVEQWQNPVRRLAMWLVKDTFVGGLHKTLRLERELLKQEWPELTQWLRIQKDVTTYAESIGLKVVFSKKDIRYRYLIFQKT